MIPAFLDDITIWVLDPSFPPPWALDLWDHYFQWGINLRVWYSWF